MVAVALPNRSSDPDPRICDANGEAIFRPVVLRTDESAYWRARMFEHVPDHFAEHVFDGVRDIPRSMEQGNEVGDRVAKVLVRVNLGQRDESPRLLVFGDLNSGIQLHEVEQVHSEEVSDCADIGDPAAGLLAAPPSESPGAGGHREGEGMDVDPPLVHPDVEVFPRIRIVLPDEAGEILKMSAVG